MIGGQWSWSGCVTLRYVTTPAYARPAIYGWDVDIHNPGWLATPSGPIDRTRLTYSISYGQRETKVSIPMVTAAVLLGLVTFGFGLLLLLGAKVETDAMWTTVQLTDGNVTHHMRLYVVDEPARHALTRALAVLRVNATAGSFRFAPSS
jgi:hypothetical protein